MIMRVKVSKTIQPDKRISFNAWSRYIKRMNDKNYKIKKR